MKRSNYFAASLALPLGLVAVTFSGCLNPSGPPAVGTGPLKIVATTSIIADAVKIVGGSHVEVHALMGPGTDPHTYLPSPSDADALASAHLVFFNGLHLEGKMSHLLEEYPQSRAVAVARGIDQKLLLTANGGDAAHDPHIWFDVKLWMSCVETIRDELAKFDPVHEAEYRERAAAHLKELDALDAEVKATVAKLPESQRILVTSHDAFGYFGRAYGFTVRGLQGVSTAAATGTKDVDDLANYLGEKRIPAVFCETSVRTKGLEKVLATVKSRYKFDVRLVGDDDALYSDALGGPGSPGETYIGMVRHNVRVIVTALQN